MYKLFYILLFFLLFNYSYVNANEYKISTGILDSPYLQIGLENKYTIGLNCGLVYDNTFIPEFSITTSIISKLIGLEKINILDLGIYCPFDSKLSIPEDLGYQISLIGYKW